MAGGAAAGPGAVHFHDFVEDGEFEGEFDGVGEGLGGFFPEPLVGGDFADDGDVEGDAEDVEVD